MTIMDIEQIAEEIGQEAGTGLPNRYPEVTRAVDVQRREAEGQLKGRIVVVWSPKGGEGKSFLSKELSWLNDLILVDLDWDGGRVSKLLGYDVDRYKQRVPLLDALERNRVPLLYKSKGRPLMVPGHPDFLANQPEPEELKRHLLRWAEGLDRGLLLDCHPGGNAAAYGALEAADLILMPVVLGTGELDAAEEALANLHQLPILLVPNKTRKVLPHAQAGRLLSIARTYNVTICDRDSFIRQYPWMTERSKRTVITAAPRFSEKSAPLAENMLALAKEVMRRAAA